MYKVDTRTLAWIADYILGDNFHGTDPSVGSI